MGLELVVVQHVAGEGPDLIANCAAERGLPMRILHSYLDEPLPDPITAPACVVVLLGGPMGVGDRSQPGLEWLEREFAWLQAWHQQRRPVLGICLGAQLLAAAAGGTVAPLLVGDPPQPLRELGYGAISWTRSTNELPLLRGLDASELVLHWHGDRLQLPPGAELLGSSLHCAEQAFLLGRHGVGLQFHVEVSGPNLERWIEADRAYVIGALGNSGPERLRRDQQRWGRQVERQGRRLLHNTLEMLSAAA